MDRFTKAAQLKMTEGKAANLLRRKIMFDLIKKCDMHYCHKCGKLMREDNFSIEHKDEWMYSADPVTSYFNLDNIAFSHSRCNRSTRGLVRFGKDAKFKGIHKNESLNRKRIWQANVWVNGKRNFIGSFVTQEEAAKAYDEAASRLLGKHHITNQKLGLLP